MNQKKDMTCDVLIVGTGVAGLYCALNLPESLDIVIISKAGAEECDSYLAQGGICVLKDEADYDAYFEDTMRAGHYENNKRSVELMIRHSPEVIADLIRFGARFEKNADGSLKYTKEGAHSTPRILFHEDITGKEITSHLLESVRAKKNVRLLEKTVMLDITEAASADGKKWCTGIVAQSEDAVFAIRASETVWACGGIGGLFEHSTNYPHLTGDALAIALKHGIALQNPDYIQIHPTTLYTGFASASGKTGSATTTRGRAFLISESVRGEGGVLYNKLPKDGGVRFINELLPRDVVTEAIHAQMKKDGTPCVWLSMEKIPREEITGHFKHIYEECLAAGYDCTKEPIPVVPAQHYFMGGVDVDEHSRTALNALYAVGETSCNGVHGKNRLASNSLLESLVFARIAARAIEKEIASVKRLALTGTEPDAACYADTDALFTEYKRIVLDEIKRMKEYHEQHHNENERRQLNSASA
ncbi:MAG: L-aspartate oxidase [Treponema sp.]|nr:L-aspartate oxidase [Treponema sp.]